MWKETFFFLQDQIKLNLVVFCLFLFLASSEHLNEKI